MYRQQVNELYHIFSLLNEKCFSNSLIQPIITLQSKGKQNAMGWCTLNKVWKGDEDEYYEINICAEYMDYPLKETVDTMLHEMVHLNNIYKEIKDTSRGGYYHNKHFRDSATKVGLNVKHDKKIGYAFTSLGDEMIEWLDKQNINRECFCIAREDIPDIKSAGERARSIKYKCPECSVIIKSTTEVNIICKDCDVEFIEMSKGKKDDE